MIDSEDISDKDRMKEECYICGHLCHPKRMLGHIRTHTNVEIYECEICGDRYSSKNTLHKHYATHKTHFICEHCHKKFVDPERLRVHICFDAEETLWCETCGREFINKSRYLKHTATHVDDKYHPCEICSKKFRFEKNLISHLKKHETGEIKSSEKNKSKLRDQIHMCLTCGKMFPTKRNLERHSASHSNDKPFVCPVCNRAFALKHNMEVHERLHYINDRPHECKKCGKCFSRRSNLKVHYAMHVRHDLGLPAPKQNNGKTFLCNICSKTFISKRNLTQHQVTHTKEKPYVCQFCGQRFSYDSCLKRHSYLHTEGAFRKRQPYIKNKMSLVGPDGQLRDKPYICQVCSADFASEKDLRAHRKSFSQSHQHKCCKCLQLYRSKKRLKEHHKIHDENVITTPIKIDIKVEPEQ